MITYVNTVLVGTGVGSVAEATNGLYSADDAGKFAVMSDKGDASTEALAAVAERIRVGYITNKTTINKATGAQMPIIKWSNWIQKDAVKSLSFDEYTADTEDALYIDLTNVTVSTLQGNRMVIRLTFKDLPTRYRKWSESYEITVPTGATLAQIASTFAKKINAEYKRARVIASVGAINTTAASGEALPNGKYFHTDANWGTATATTGTTIKLLAMKYTDDDAVDTINVYNKVRFTANMWMTDPEALGFASKNKYSIDGGSIMKVEGKTYTASAKLVRDAEAQAMGYQGILNRGEGTWPIIKPEMNTDINATYDAITLEFENKYDTADDLKRNTKQTLQIFYKSTATETLDASSGLFEVLKAFVGRANNATDAQVIEHTAIDEPGV